MYLLCCQICNVYSEDIDIKDLEKYFLASSQGQAPGFSPKNFITSGGFLSGQTEREDSSERGSLDER